MPKRIRKLLCESFKDENGNNQPSYLSVAIDELYFKDEITCPICLGLLNKTWTVMACLHRFCFDCFHRSLRMELGPKSQKECPLCRVKLASRRASRADNSFDIIVNMLNHNSAYEDKVRNIETDMICSDNDLPAENEGGKSYKRGSEKNEQQIFIDLNHYRKIHENNISKFRQRQHQFRVNQMNENERKKARNDSITFPRGLSNIRYVCFSLLPNRRLTTSEFHYMYELLKSPYTRAPEDIQVGDIKSYLHYRRDVHNKDAVIPHMASIRFQISILYKNEEMFLDDSLTLKDICYNLWNRSTELIIFFQ